MSSASINGVTNVNDSNMPSESTKTQVGFRPPPGFEAVMPKSLNGMTLPPSAGAPPGLPHPASTLSVPLDLKRLEENQSDTNCCSDDEKTSIGDSVSSSEQSDSKASSLKPCEASSPPRRTSPENDSPEASGAQKLNVAAPSFVPTQVASSKQASDRTKLRSVASEFKPSLPFVPSATVAAAWNRWQYEAPTQHDPYLQEKRVEEVKKLAGCTGSHPHARRKAAMALSQQGVW